MGWNSLFIGGTTLATRMNLGALPTLALLGLAPAWLALRQRGQLPASTT